MFAKTLSGTPYGAEARLVEVQCDTGAGYPSFAIVGLAEREVSEARERVRTALRNAGISLPEGRITANLAPADLRKEGAGLDLALAVALLVAAGTVPRPTCPTAYLGELGLDGRLRPVRGVLAVALIAHEAGVKEMLVPKESAPEAALVEGLTVYGAETLHEVVLFLRKERPLDVVLRHVPPAVPQMGLVDLGFVRGQEQARRALEIAAAGGHNLLTLGTYTILFGMELAPSARLELAGLIDRRRPGLAEPQAPTAAPRNPSPEASRQHDYTTLPDPSAVDLEVPEPSVLEGVRRVLSQAVSSVGLWT